MPGGTPTSEPHPTARTLLPPKKTVYWGGIAAVITQMSSSSLASLKQLNVSVGIAAQVRPDGGTRCRLLPAAVAARSHAVHPPAQLHCDACAPLAA